MFYDIIIGEHSASPNHLKYKQNGPKYDIIGARELGRNIGKACTYGGGADV